MATEAILQSLSVPTGSRTDLSSDQYRAITIDTSGQAVLSDTGYNSDGFLQNNPKAGQIATVAIFGKSKALVDAASVSTPGSVSIGDLLEVGDNGGVITASMGTVVAKALEAGAAGSIVSVLILKSNAVYT